VLAHSTALLLDSKTGKETLTDDEFASLFALKK
jgi:hypothetical protein